MARPKSPSAAPENIAYYDALLVATGGIERKGASNAYTAHNGNMFSYMDGSGVLALRLPEPEKSEFMSRFDASLHEAYGVVQKNYVSVPERVLCDTPMLEPYFAAAWRHVQTLKPKPTKR